MTLGNLALTRCRIGHFFLIHSFILDRSSAVGCDAQYGIRHNLVDGVRNKLHSVNHNSMFVSFDSLAGDAIIGCHF